jgi:cell filamentation protein
MPYSPDSDPYLDQETGVLINRLGISDAEVLEQAEADISAVAIATLGERQHEGDFDLEHLNDIHFEIFHDIYPWAGELRTVDLAKDDTKFANCEFLEKAAVGIFNNLHAEKLLDGLEGGVYVERFAHYYSEVNILHPFREGNGRTQRAFFTQLAAKAGKFVAWDKMDGDKNITASALAYKGDESQLVVVLKALISERM